MTEAGEAGGVEVETASSKQSVLHTPSYSIICVAASLEEGRGGLSTLDRGPEGRGAESR
jgi:hypothetical protein